MKLIKPVVLNESMLIDSTVAEDEHPFWNPAAAYATGFRVIRPSEHKVYEHLGGGTVGLPPEEDVAHWGLVGPTNRWKMFDQSAGTVTEAGAETLTVVIEPGLVDSLALIDIQASSVRVQMLDAPGGAPVYDQTFSGDPAGGGIDDWYDYFFLEVARRTLLIVEDLPPYVSGRITVTLTDTVEARCGTLAVGALHEIGLTRRGAAIGIIDYSKKTTDAYGTTSIVQRAYAKKLDVPVVVKNARLDYVAALLALVRATPCVWIASDRALSLVVYGFAKDWGITISYPDHAEARLSIEGLA